MTTKSEYGNYPIDQLQHRFSLVFRSMNVKKMRKERKSGSIVTRLSQFEEENGREKTSSQVTNSNSSSRIKNNKNEKKTITATTHRGTFSSFFSRRDTHTSMRR